MYESQETIVAGDKAVFPFRLEYSGFDWAGATVTAQVRSSPTGAVLATPAQTLDSGTLGVLTGTLTLSKTQTDALPKRCYLELEAEKEASGFGPVTIFRIELTVEPDIARP
jgi:hypothetical protein